MAKGVERNLAYEAAFILAYRDPHGRTPLEQQTITLAFQEMQWEGQLDG